MKKKEKEFILAEYEKHSYEKQRMLEWFNQLQEIYGIKKSSLPLGEDMEELIKAIYRRNKDSETAWGALGTWRRYHEEFEKTSLLWELIERFNLRGE